MTRSPALKAALWVAAAALLAHFGSAKAVEGAALADLEAVDGISKTFATKIYDYFHSTP